MSNISENIESIVRIIGCEYEIIDKSYSGQQLTQLYLKEYENGRRNGYTPIILSCDDSLAETLEINCESNGNVDEYRNKLLSVDQDHGMSFLRNRFEEYIEEIKKYSGGDVDIHGDFEDNIEPQRFLNSLSASELILVKIPTSDPWKVFAWISFGGWNECPDAEDMMAVCKYWYRLYKAVPAVISGDTLQIYGFEPVKDRSDALKLAEEQYGFCNDIIDQGMEKIKPLASLLMDSTVWSFWWD